MFTYNTETLNGTKYYTTTNARGTTTMIEESHGTIFVWVNRSAPKALQDIKKQSKQLQSLLAVMEADKEEEAAAAAVVAEEISTEEKAEEIEKKIQTIQNNPESKEGAKGFYIYNPSALKKMDDLTWQLYWLASAQRTVNPPTDSNLKFW